MEIGCACSARLCPQHKGGVRLLDVTAAVILDKGGRILLARRSSADKNAPGRWEFPGGKVEEGETAPACLQRELCEELGVTAQIGDYICTGIDAERGIRLLAYYAHIISGPIMPTVHDEVRWVERVDLRSYPMPPADAPIVETLLQKAGAPANRRRPS